MSIPIEHNTKNHTKKKVLIIGGGFAGINLARKLDSTLFDVMIFDKINQIDKK